MVGQRLIAKIRNGRGSFDLSLTFEMKELKTKLSSLHLYSVSRKARLSHNVSAA